LDAKYFSLGILLSSLLIINLKNTIKRTDIDNLQYPLYFTLTSLRNNLVTKLTSFIKTSQTVSDDDAGSDFRIHFPHLLFLVRDFTLQFGSDVPDEDAYLRSALALKKGKSEEIQRTNLTKQELIASFPRTSCICLEPPVLFHIYRF
jgi:hypothetical protein